MRSSTSFCRIPGGPRGSKWPTLNELHVALFGTTFESAHNAVADVRACGKCFFELKRKGIVADAATLADDDEASLDDRELFDEIYLLAGQCPWFDTDRFVDNVFAQFEERGLITDAQRDALIRIRDMLEEKAG